MVQKGSWHWLLDGFRIDLETQVKPKTARDYCDHVRYFTKWAQANNRGDPRSIVKRDIQEFLHFVGSSPATIVAGNGTKRQIQRNQNSRWHHYFPLRRFFTWAVSEGYFEQNPVDGIMLKPPKAAAIEPYKPEQIEAFVEPGPRLASCNNCKAEDAGCKKQGLVVPVSRQLHVSGGMLSTPDRRCRLG